MSHHHHHHHEHAGEANKNLGIAFWLNAVFVVIEAVGGFWTNSIAILSDSLHDLGDCASLGLAWWLQRKSQQGRDAHYSYGYRRFSLLGAVFLSAILLVSSLFMLGEAIKRMITPAEVQAQGMIWLAVVGILINGAAALRLNHGHSLNERAVYLHIMEDVLGWVAVLIAAVVMYFVDVPILDPIMSACISLWILYNVGHNLRDTFRIFLQNVPEELDQEALHQALQEVEGLHGFHDLHVWTLDGEVHVMTLHAVLEPEADAHKVKEAVHEAAHPFHIEHVTIETEALSEPCEHSCDKKE